jgi:serine/threonine-protein kinase ULK2
MVGRPPFRAQNHVELLRKIEKGEDRIKFPDESSSRSRTDGDRDKPEETAGPPVAADVKNLIRRLLKRVPVQRMSFEDFFACKVWDGYMKTVGYQDQTAGPEPSGTVVIGSTMTRNSPGPAEKRSTPPHRAQREQTTPRRPSEPKYFVSNMASRSVVEDSEDGSQNKASFTQDMDRRDDTNTSRATPVRAGPSRQNSGSDDVTVGRPSRGATPLQPTSSEHDQQSSASATDTNEYVVVEKRTVEVNALADGKPQSVHWNIMSYLTECYWV